MSRGQRSPAIRPGFVLSAVADLDEVRQLLTGDDPPQRLRATHALKRNATRRRAAGSTLTAVDDLTGVSGG